MSVVQQLTPVFKKSILDIGPRLFTDQKNSINVFYLLRLKIIMAIVSQFAGRRISSLNEAKQFLAEGGRNNKIKLAFALLASDMICNSIMLALGLKLIPDSLGAKVMELNVKLAATIAKRTLNDEKVQARADEILKKLQDSSPELHAMSGNYYGDKSPESIKKSMDMISPITGKYLLMAGIAAALNEEASKRVSLELGFGKEYFAVFNAFEFTQYVLQLSISGGSLKTAIFIRAITVLVHAALTGLNKIGLHRTAILAHFLHNTFSIGIQEIYSMIVSDVSLSQTAVSKILEQKIAQGKQMQEAKVEQGLKGVEIPSNLNEWINNFKVETVDKNEHVDKFDKVHIFRKYKRKYRGTD